MSVLLSNLVARPPTIEDYSAIAELVTACDIAEHGIADSSTRDLASRWQNDCLHLESDAWVWHRDYEEFYTFICVHPQYRKRGIGTLLLRMAEQRARELLSHASPRARVSLRAVVTANNAQARSLFEREGYLLMREFWRVTLELVEASGDGAGHAGKFTIDLDVESGRLVGAALAYDREGLYSVRQFVTYEKELRPADEEIDYPDDTAETLIRIRA